MLCLHVPVTTKATIVSYADDIVVIVVSKIQLKEAFVTCLR